MPVAFGPIAATAASSSGWRRPVIKTRAPSVAKRLAVARPMPVVPPVMTAIFPSSLRTMICLLCGARQIYGGVLLFEIEMNANHRCRIVDVKAARFRRARHVREGRRRRFVRCGGNGHGGLGRHGLPGSY